MGTFLVVAATFGAVLGGLSWLAARVRRRGIGGEAMSVVEEIYRPSAHRSRLVIQMLDERMVPMPSPDDLWGRLRRTVRRTPPARSQASSPGSSSTA